MTDRELMQMALDALRMCNAETMYASQRAAMANLNERLSQPEPNPSNSTGLEPVADCDQMPVAWMNEKAGGYRYYSWQKQYPNDTPLYTTPPKCEWVGLTDEEIQTVVNKVASGEYQYSDTFARAIEAKLKEKNT